MFALWKGVGSANEELLSRVWLSSPIGIDKGVMEPYWPFVVVMLGAVGFPMGVFLWLANDCLLILNEIERVQKRRCQSAN